MRSSRCALTDITAVTAHSKVGELSSPSVLAPSGPNAAENPVLKLACRWSMRRVACGVVTDSSCRTISSLWRAVAAQCTRRMESPCRYSRVMTSSSLGFACRCVAAVPSLPRDPESGEASSSRGAGVTTRASVPPSTWRDLPSPKGAVNSAVAGPISYIPREPERSRYSYRDTPSGVGFRDG
ncbi:hypothetical protein AC792_04175 [Arthrobacter sp. RIT-PI-e]|nr:hypothetical protein [Arthrobacter sp. RIT-PI-e]KNC19843.1 hypothetical protein AC792_04175 [Arthrobacter sp. RIT-PI-e]